MYKKEFDLKQGLVFYGAGSIAQFLLPATTATVQLQLYCTCQGRQNRGGGEGVRGALHPPPNP